MNTPDQNAQKRAAIVPVPLVGEPITDRAFKSGEDSKTYRVRVIEADTSSAMITMANGTPAPFLKAFDISIVQLDDQGNPTLDPQGKVVVSANTRWTVTPSAEDPRATLQRLIEQMIYTASSTHMAQAALGAISADWGASVTASASIKA